MSRAQSPYAGGATVRATPPQSPCVGCAHADRDGSCRGGQGASLAPKAGCRAGELFQTIGGAEPLLAVHA